MYNEQLSPRWSHLSPAKRLLLEKRMRREVAPQTEAVRIVRRPGRESAPLSSGQQRLWFLQQMEPESSVYNIARSMRLTGQVSLPALEQTLAEIRRRHESLRTVFLTPDEEPVQVIKPARATQLPVVDLSGLTPEFVTKQALRLSSLESRRPFDLAAGPLLRNAVMRLAPGDCVLLLSMHHIISDAFSADILIHEMDAVYASAAAGRPSPLAELPIQYADFAHWQREWLQGPVLEQQLAYWRERLGSRPPVLELPADRPRPAVRSSRGDTRSLVLPEALGAALKGLCRREGATLFMSLVAAFKALLYRYTGQEDIVVGTVAATRSRPEIEKLIGYFADTLVLRTSVAAGLSFGELLTRVRESFGGAYAHRDISFERLVQELQPERDLSHTPLFQVGFSLRTLPPAAAPNATTARANALRKSLLPTSRGTARHDLTLLMVEQGDRLTAVLEYSTDLFHAATMTRMLGHFHRLLSAAAVEPAQTVAALPLITEAERHQLLREWNDTTTTNVASDDCLHQLFAEQARLRPDAVALDFAGARLTYGELERRGNQLARHLQRLGVKPETRVGVLLERSAEMVLAVLGIVKAGGAYVPLDPAWPAQRLRFILSSLAVNQLLTQASQLRVVQELEPQLPALTDVVCLDMQTEPPPAAPSHKRLWTSWHLRRLPAHAPASRTTPDNLAYIIFTSGSTGEPKGVGCSHRGVVNLLADFTRRQPIAAGDDCSFWTSLNFDVSVYEIFSALAAGATLHVVPDEMRADSSLFIEWLRRQRITSAYVSPFMLRDLADWLAQAGHTLELRRLLVGVEPIPQQLLCDLKRQLTGLHIVNGYGPTETTICATLYSVPPDAGDRSNVPIGRAARNMEVYVLDRQLEPVPIGVPGELFIGGVGLARGYTHHAALTAEKFVPDKFSAAPGRRLYQTGDVVTRLPDGNLEFLGRSDNQVKVRGYRIELGEIEAALAEHPSVREAAAAVKDGGGAAQLLVGYFVAHGAETPTTAELRHHLKERLPEYMIPSVFVSLERLPANANGKLDRRRLPAPNGERPALAAAYVAPSNQLEGDIALVWRELLQVEQVGVEDNFFDLGGHSLLIIRAHKRLQAELSIEFSVVDMFQHPTVGSLAQYLEQKRRGQSAAPQVNERDDQLAAGKKRLQRMKQARRGDRAES